MRHYNHHDTFKAVCHVIIVGSYAPHWLICIHKILSGLFCKDNPIAPNADEVRGRAAERKRMFSSSVRGVSECFVYF